jgi:hypothetical protein
MKRVIVWAFLVVAASAIVAAPARADRGGFGRGGFGRGGVFMPHQVFDHRFDRRFDTRFFGRGFFDRRFFFPHRVFFRPFFFFGQTIVAPLPIELFAPPASPAYLMGPIDGAPGCYDYQTTIAIEGQMTPAYGAACMAPDGSWQVVS